MAETEIECPKCGTNFSVTDALSAEIEERFNKKFQKASQKREAEIEKLQEELEKDKKSLAKKQQDFDKAFQDKLESEKQELEKRVRAKLQEASRVELEDLRNQINEKSKLVQEAQKIEIEMRKKARELEEKDKNLELELQRKFDLEREKLEEDVSKRVSDEQRLRVAEKDKQLDEMRRQIEDLKRKAEQGSQQTQGEVFEIEIESALRSIFPHDHILPVPKGMKGGDIIQEVHTPNGQKAGTIIWETKRTKTWIDSWVDKLKEDQRSIAAEFAVLVSQCMPKGVPHLAQIDGIWVVDFLSFSGLAVALRTHVIQIFQARAMSAGKGEKLDFLYGYLTGTQFRQRIEAIVESFKTMQEDLEKERRVIQKSWAAREQQIARVLTSTVGMYGDIQGIVGASLPKISALELEDPSDTGNSE